MTLHHVSGHRIATSYAPPPIPYRGVDWAAWLDDLGADDSPCGRGATENAAIADLLDYLDNPPQQEFLE